MQKKHWLLFWDILLTVVVLTLAFMASLAVQTLLKAETLITAVFMLAIFLISLITDGYLFGIIGALISVLMVNFAFTFPFFEFNFTIQENLISAFLMIILTVLTSTLTTKLKRQERLRVENEKEKMRANLLRAVSHDLRTPLTTIYGASSTMIENFDALPEADKRQLLLGIKEDSQWLIRMVENLLSVTKIDNSNLQLNKRSTVLEELVDAALSKFAKRYPAQQVQVHLPEEFVTVAVDAILVQQVLVNLLENAVQHAVGMKNLQFCVQLQSDEVVFCVIDDGCGVEKEKLKTLFSGTVIPTQSTADRTKHSMGIGLSVCATIIKAHGGRIWAENRPEGGMCFAFTLKQEESGDE